MSCGSSETTQVTPAGPDGIVDLERCVGRRLDQNTKKVEPLMEQREEWEMGSWQ